MQHLLGYTKWDNFQKVISKAKIACETAGHRIADHFADIGKMVKIGSGTEREIQDFMLTRFACYLIAQNGDPQKEAIALPLERVRLVLSRYGERIYPRGTREKRVVISSLICRRGEFYPPAGGFSKH